MKKLLLSISLFLLFSLTSNGQNLFGPLQLISNDTPETSLVLAGNIDGDKYWAILSYSYTTRQLIWYKNQGNGDFSSEILISTKADGANSVFAIDLDSDSDIDVISTSFIDGKLSWYKNDGNGNFSGEIIISINLYNVGPIYAIDIDKDGDWLITYDELMEFHIARFGNKPPPPGFWERFDKNKDGIVEWEEFSGPKGTEGPPKNPSKKEL